MTAGSSVKTVLIGREAERARIDELIARARRGRSGSLVVLGDAGQGKTALLDYAAEQARGMTVVRAVGVEAEAELEFAGLLELVRPLFGHLQELPAAQADALRAVLGMGAAASLDRFVVGAATLSLLATAAESTPLLAVVDDAHWLDRPTIDALRFAAKRLEADAVVVLLGARPDERVDLAGIEQLELGPLAAPDAERLLAEKGI